MKTTWYSILVIGLVLLLASSVVGCALSYTQEDLDAAYEVGHAEGYDAGLAELESAKQGAEKLGYDKGYNSGYEAGYDIGKKEGRTEGYDSGYQVGYEDGESALPEPDTSPPTQPEESQVIEDLAYIEVFALGYSDDADPADDGISVHIAFYDTKSETIRFQDIPVEVTIKLYAYEGSLSSSLRKRELVYREQVTIDHSTGILGAEIRIPFEDIEVSRSKLKYGNGKIEITVTMPNQGTFQDDAVLLL